MPYAEFTASCLGVVILVGIAIALLVRVGRRQPPDRSDREIIAEIRALPVEGQLETLKDADPRTRLCAAAAMTGTRDRRLINALIDALQDEDAEVVSTVLKVLGDLNDRDAADAFLARLQTDETIPFRANLLPRRFFYRTDELVDWLLFRARCGEEEALDVIGRYGTDAEVDYLLELLQSGMIPMWDRRREKAADALAALYLAPGVKPKQKEAIESLEWVLWVDSRLSPALADQGESAAEPGDWELTMNDFIKRRDPEFAGLPERRHA